jgi:D-amino-acid dehydrogenase
MAHQTRKSDVIIIGGGVIGLTCAYFLNRAGRSVRVLERDQLGNGSSFGNAGLITPSHAEPVCSPGVMSQAFKWMLDSKSPFYVRPRFDPLLWLWSLDFARNCKPEIAQGIAQSKCAILGASRKLTEQLIKTENLDCDWGVQGMISVCLEHEQLEKLRHFARSMLKLGIVAELIDGPALKAKEPALSDAVIGGVYFPRDALLRPNRFISQLVEVLREKGVMFEENTPVDAINVDGDRLHSAYARKIVFEADHFVLACGAWSPQLAKSLGLRLPVQPGKGYSVTSIRPDPCPNYALILEERKLAVTPWQSGYRVSGTMEFSGFDESPNKARSNALIEGAEMYLRDAIAPGEPTRWFGYRPMTPDDLPIIGASPGHQNLTLATGHNMLGMSMAASTGRLVAELICNKKPHLDPTPYSPERFHVTDGLLQQLKRALPWVKPDDDA